MSDEKFLKRQELRRKFAEFVQHYPLSTEDIDGEIWRDVVGYEGIYRVSNFGRVKSFQYITLRKKVAASKNRFLTRISCRTAKEFTLGELITNVKKIFSCDGDCAVAFDLHGSSGGQLKSRSSVGFPPERIY